MFRRRLFPFWGLSILSGEAGGRLLLGVGLRLILDSDLVTCVYPLRWMSS